MACVLICGIAVVDFVYRMEALPDRAEKYRAQAMEVVGGGCAANAAVAVARLGGTARLMTRLGDDATGATIRDGLLAEGVDMTDSVVTPGALSPLSSVMVDAAGERMIVNFPGSGLADAAPVPPLADAVLVDTRWPGAALPLLLAAQVAGVPGVLDAEAPVSPAMVEAASHVVFSAQGLRDFAGQEDCDAALLAVAAGVSGWIGYTDGAAGLTYVAGGRLHRIAPPRVDVVDSLGAGDVWHGAFTLALAEGQAAPDAARFANVAAALKCTGFGGVKATPNRLHVIDMMKEMI